MWCSTADTHIKQLERVVSRASFLTGVCDIAHRRSVTALFMPYKIRCNPMHPLYGALTVPYVPVRVTRGALVTHRYTYMRRLAAEPRYHIGGQRHPVSAITSEDSNNLQQRTRTPASKPLQEFQESCYNFSIDLSIDLRMQNTRFQHQVTIFILFALERNYNGNENVIMFLISIIIIVLNTIINDNIIHGRQPLVMYCRYIYTHTQTQNVYKNNNQNNYENNVNESKMLQFVNNHIKISQKISENLDSNDCRLIPRDNPIYEL